MDTQPVILNNKGFFWEAADFALKASLPNLKVWTPNLKVYPVLPSLIYFQEG
jgi:hypothetical protein